jgi:hypothetical protein
MVSKDRIIELKYAFAHLNPIFISAQAKTWVDELKQSLKEALFEGE